MKNLKIVMIAILMVLLLAIILIKNLGTLDDSSIKNNDAKEFKQEYENLNGVINGDKTIKAINIPEENPMVYATYEEIEDVITNKTGVIYFGFPECPWCRNAVPVLIDAANEVGVDKIYYFNALEIRDIKSLDDAGNIVVEKEGTEEYKKLVQLLYDYLGEYEGLNDPTIKRLYFPTVLFVKDGNIIGSHMGTVDSQENPYVSLTNSEYEQLKDIYSGYMLKVLGIICENDAESKC